MSTLITNSNIKLEFACKFNLYSLVLKFGGIYKKDYRAAVRLRFVVYSFILKKKFMITILVYSTGSIIITNLPFLVDSRFQNIGAQSEITNLVFSKIKEISKCGVYSAERSVKIHGSKIFDEFKILNNWILCSVNNITLSFKSQELSYNFDRAMAEECIQILQAKLPDYNISEFDNPDSFPAFKLFIVGNLVNGVKINLTIYKLHGQIMFTGIKNFSDCALIGDIVRIVLENCQVH